ncbi:MBL fold metallo-hydrolase [Kineothrix sp. MSJ-39]|uniref:ComEC/Rec2 family competence protein n=1 Tax=Kineothrix sp. MSJ-39 TaxID=2841533 RepID=UPI001C11389C|nr:ComEC/Rec2 family competence protein [Kineothrix sp. MSJ-39]MBU5430104.1 MBL fold metallo-hydrolase [Kineothrix sp. MSJ-39]
MKKRKKQNGRLLAPILALIILLAACSSQGSDTKQADTSQPAAQTEQAAVTEQSQSSAQDGQLAGDALMQPSGDAEEEKTDAADQGQEPLEVHYIDVGQGNAILLKSGRHAMLVDAGNSNQGTKVQLYLTKQGVENLDYLVLTHPDADHIGGAPVIITKYDIGQIFLSNYEKDNQTIQKVNDAMQYKNLTAADYKVGDTFALGNASFTILGPVKEYADSNNASVALMVQNGNNRFLFTGDCESEAEADMVASQADLQADVYLAGHHGSDTASSQILMDAVSPTYAVISCGEGNSYGHPHAEVLNRFRSMGIQVFRTDEQGSVVAKSDGTEITWNCAPSETWQAGERTKNAQTGAEEAEIQPANETTMQETDTAAVQDTPATQQSDAVTLPAQEQKPVVVEETPQAGNYIGNRNNGKLHKASCSYLPDPQNQVPFATREEAVAAGYDDPCKRCNP